MKKFIKRKKAEAVPMCDGGHFFNLGKNPAKIIEHGIKLHLCECGECYGLHLDDTAKVDFDITKYLADLEKRVGKEATVYTPENKSLGYSDGFND